MTYKKLIENQTKRHIENFIENNIGTIKIINVDSLELTIEKDDITFIATVTVYNNPVTRDYRVFGYINEYGTINICNVSYTRFFTSGDFPHNEFYIVDSEELKTFKFDK